MLVKIPQPVVLKDVYVNPDLVAAVVMVKEDIGGTEWLKITFIGSSGEEIVSVTKSDRDATLHQWKSEVLELLNGKAQLK